MLQDWFTRVPVALRWLLDAVKADLHVCRVLQHTIFMHRTSCKVSAAVGVKAHIMSSVNVSSSGVARFSAVAIACSVRCPAASLRQAARCANVVTTATLPST